MRGPLVLPNKFFMTQKKLNTYLGLCTEVYELSKPTAPEDAYAFYRSYVSQTKDPILEPMCGTGRFLLPLIEEGFDIQGFDASEYMLNTLNSKANKLNLTPNVWQGFIRELKRQDRYGLIFIPSGSFGLLDNPSAAKAALKIFYDHLNKDGTLLFEVETLKSAPNQFGLWKASTWHRNDGKIIIANFLDLPIKNNIQTTLCKYELVDANQTINTEFEELKVQLYNPRDLTHILKNVGFRDIRIVKAFDKSQMYNQNNKLVVFECRKWKKPRLHQPSWIRTRFFL